MRIQQSVKKNFDKAVAKLPASTKRGFRDGRQAGNNAVEAIPYGIGAVAGFTYGIGEAIVGALAGPVGSVFGCRSLAHGE